MIKASTPIEKEVKAFCARIGADPLLVQGAGGNVSWKDGDVLWVKASGTWLAEAESKEIFVPVNLAHLQDALAKQDFSVKPVVNNNSGLRPSIETLLHALMPSKVVVHLHAVEILAHLVRVDAQHQIEKLVGDAVRWIFVDYFKPGPDLAKCISEDLTKWPDAQVVFLRNHGIVIAGNDIEEVASMLDFLILQLKTTVHLGFTTVSPTFFDYELLRRGYLPCDDFEINQLAMCPQLIERLGSAWALYPDQVVFLGKAPVLIDKECGFLDFDKVLHDVPPVIFVVGRGVMTAHCLTPAQLEQLKCYYNVLIRQSKDQELKVLSESNIADLLDWESEKYRYNIDRVEKVNFQ